MSPTLTKVVRVVAGIALLQGALVGGYLLLRRDPAPPAPVELSLLTPAPLPALVVTSPRGERQLDGLRGPLLLHFWATWCVPCREELPALLSLSEGGAKVVAVSVDESQRSIDAFFDGVVPDEVWRIDHDVARAALGVRRLPVTLFVDRSGRIVARSELAQTWTTATAQDAFARAFSRGR